MSLAQIEYFVAVAEEQSLGRAALRLHVSQPPLTRQIRALEEELGVPLFARSPRGMHLLPAGQRLLVHARRILEELKQARGVGAGAGAAGTSAGGGARLPDTRLPGARLPDTVCP